MARFKYVCGDCGNEVPAERIEKRVPGTKGQVRVFTPVYCEARGCTNAMQMTREEYTPPRREVRAD
jgi:hypothetical protein